MTPSPEALRSALIAVIRARSFQLGPEVKLASGRTSTFYFNMKPTMLDAEGGALIAQLVLDAIAPLDVAYVGGLEMGAVPIAAATAALSHTSAKPVRAFIVRKAAKEHGTQSLIEGLPRGETLAGQRVVILEDVTTTGGSAIKAVDAVRAQGAHVALVLTIVDREEGAASTFAAAGLKFNAVLRASDFK